MQEDNDSLVFNGETIGVVLEEHTSDIETQSSDFKNSKEQIDLRNCCMESEVNNNNNVKGCE